MDDLRTQGQQSDAEREPRIAAGSEIDLGAAELRVLQDLVRHVGPEARLHRRARAVLLAADGCSIRAIAQELGTCRARVRDWLVRFRERRLEGLGEAARPGRPPSLTPEVKERVLDMARRSPREFGVRQDRWTGASLRETVLSKGWVESLSQTSLWRLLAEARAELAADARASWDGSDPSLEGRMSALTDLYGGSSEHTPVLCLACKSMERHQRAFTWSHPEVGDAPCARVVASMAAHAWKVEVECLPNKAGGYLSEFLRARAPRVAGLTTDVVLDVSLARQLALEGWQDDAYRLHEIPLELSWMNRIEPWLALLETRLSLGPEGAASIGGLVQDFAQSWNQRVCSGG